MKVVVLLLAISIFHRGEGCLKVRMVAPPKCECQALGLDGTNIAEYVTDTELLNNFTKVPIISPVVEVDDCSGTVYCVGEYRLFIVDTDKITDFGKYAVEGLCDPFTQTWQVDDGGQDYGFSTYQRLYGVCIHESISQTECGCPAIGTIDQAGIQRDEYNYLGGRRTVDAKITVSDSCEVTVDATASGDGDFHLFIYRSPFPPIMMKRLLPSTPSAQRVFKLDIQCASVNGIYEWQFKGSKISSQPMDLALMENEDACKCTPISTEKVKGEKIGNHSYLNGTCDLQHISCHEENKVFDLLVSDTLIVGGEYQSDPIYRVGREFDAVSATCVAGTQWVYNNYILHNPEFSCSYQWPSVPGFVEACKCGRFRQMKSDPNDLANQYRNQFDFDHESLLSGMISTEGTQESDSDTCVVKLQCPQGDNIVLLGRGMKPKFYPPGTVLTSRCMHSPMSELEYVWWTNEYMVTGLSFTCFTPQ